MILVNRMDVRGELGACLELGTHHQYLVGAVVMLCSLVLVSRVLTIIGSHD
jgi:hypothetical protein